jgi:hypothetical protein
MLRRASTIACLLSVVAVASAADDGAIIAGADGDVDVAGLGASKGTAIAPGSSVVTAGNAHADVKLRDGAHVRLAPSTTFYVLGKPAPKGSKKPSLSDSTLVKGTIWIASASSAMAPIVTPAGKVVAAPSSEAKLHVEGGVTRVSVHKGKVTANGAEVAEGFGLKGKSKAKLPAAPAWTAPPKPFTFTLGSEETITGMIAGHAAKWHLQVAMDEGMNDVLVDITLVADGPTLLVEQKLPPGHYFMRVAALGSDGLESAWSSVAPATIIKKK